MWISCLLVLGAGNKVWVIRSIWGSPCSLLSSPTSPAPGWEAAGTGLSEPGWFPQPFLPALSTPTPWGSPAKILLTCDLTFWVHLSWGMSGH